VLDELHEMTNMTPFFWLNTTKKELNPDKKKLNFVFPPNILLFCAQYIFATFGDSA
jgi:hypothetical protein